MALDPIVGVAEAIKISLNSGTFIDKDGNEQQFSRQFASQRHYLTPFAREETGLKVTVMPTAALHELVARNNVSTDTLRVQVGVQDEVDPNDLSVIDKLMKFVSEIKTHIRNARMEYLDTENITLIAVEHDPIWDQEHLRDHRQFRTAPTFVFREIGRL